MENMWTNININRKGLQREILIFFLTNGWIQGITKLKKGWRRISMKIIHTNHAPQAIGPYSQAVKAGDFLFVSGQIPVNPETGEIADGIVKQTEQIMKNIDAILKEAGLSFANVVKFTIFTTSMDDFPTINETFAKFLTEPYPARATVEVSRLPKDVQVEIEAIAYCGE
jgi:2-iminobutanoate/2-iminopropanoate deaminase